MPPSLFDVRARVCHKFVFAEQGGCLSFPVAYALSGWSRDTLDLCERCARSGPSDGLAVEGLEFIGPTYPGT